MLVQQVLRAVDAETLTPGVGKQDVSITSLRLAQPPLQTTRVGLAMGREQNLPVPRVAGISLVPHCLRKRLDIFRKRSLRRSRQDNSIVDDEFHGRLLSSLCTGLRSQYYVDATMSVGRKHKAGERLQDIPRKGT